MQRHALDSLSSHINKHAETSLPVCTPTYVSCDLPHAFIHLLSSPHLLCLSPKLSKQDAACAGIAVSCGGLVGLDVEETLRHTRSDPLKLARRRLAPAELASLESKLCMQQSQI